MRTGMRGKTNRTVMAGGLDRTYIVYLPDGVVADRRRCRSCSSITATRCRVRTCTTSRAIPRSPIASTSRSRSPTAKADRAASAHRGTSAQNVCTSYEGAPPRRDRRRLRIPRRDEGRHRAGSVPRSRTRVRHRLLDGRLLRARGRLQRRRHRAASRRTPAARTISPAARTRRMPIIMFHGASDPVIPAGCDDPNAGTGHRRRRRRALGRAQRLRGDDDEPRRRERHVHHVRDGCPAGGQVELCTFNAMGHCWAGGDGTNIYSCGNYESATQLEWSVLETERLVAPVSPHRSFAPVR